MRELWIRRWRALLSLLALALSVGLLVATGSLSALMEASVAAPVPLLGRTADLWVSSAYDADYDLPAELEARIAAVPGVSGVQPLLRRPVHVHTPQPDTLALVGVELGAYFAAHDLSLAAGVLPTQDRPGVVALAPWAFARELGLGQPVTVTAAQGEMALPLAGLVEVESLAAGQQGLVLYAPLDVAADLIGVRGAVTAFEIQVAAGTSPRRVRAALEEILGPAHAVWSAAQPGQGAQLWQRLVLGALLCVDGLSMIGSMGLVHAVFAAAARSRRRQAGLLRAVGARRGQVWALSMVEGLLLGLAGSGLGLAVGLLLARAGASRVLEAAAGPVPAPPAAWVVLAVALGIASGLAGAARPALQSVRQPVLSALYPRPATWPGDRCRRVRSLPLLTPIAAAAAQRFSGSVRLVGASLARERGRSVLIVASLAAVSGMALGDVGVLSLLSSVLADNFGRLNGGDYLLLPGLNALSLRELTGQDTSDVPPLAPGLLAALETLEGQIWTMGGTTADIAELQVFPGQPTLLLDVEGYAHMGGFRFQAGDWPGALETFRRGPAVLLTSLAARRLDAALGGQVRLETLRGPVDFTVAGVGESEFTTCVLDMDDGAAYFGANEVNAVELQLRPGADDEAVQRALLNAVQTHGGTLLPLSQATAQLRVTLEQVRLSVALLIGLAGLVAECGVVNAMLASVAERRQEIGMLRAVGATRWQVCKLILGESAVLGALASLLGSALGWAVTLLFLAAARSTLGLMDGSFSPAAWLPLLGASAAACLLCPLLAALGGLGAAVHAARLPVVEALREVGQ